MVRIQTKERIRSKESGRNCIKRGFTISTLHQKLLITEQINDKMIGVCTIHGEVVNSYILLCKSGGMRPLGRPRRG
jgi:hypothetical protein